MAVWRGIPLRSAIIVRHTPRDYGRRLGRKDTGAMPCSSNGRALDYVSRTGAFSDRSDIDRSPTDADRELVAERDAGDRLDYAAREGSYADKGAGRQEDASLWGPDGPVSVEDARARMRADGGAFIDSIVAVDRDCAPALHLDTKEDMQRLVRATWAENVERWGLIERPEDIRWVAAYHTDAAQSVHCHILTWSARGEIEQGATVPREGTREGKEAIYRMGYARIREERDERSNFLRDLSRQQATVLVGGRCPDGAFRRLEEKAGRLGYAERPLRSSDVPDDKRGRIDALRERVRSELASGSGSVARNRRAQAAARDVVDALRRDSPAFARTWAEHEACSDVKADLKGYPADSRARQDLARDDREDLKSRTASAVARACLPDDARERMDAGRRAWREGGREGYAEYQKGARDRRSSRIGAEEARERGCGRPAAGGLAARNAAASALGANLVATDRMARLMSSLSRDVRRGETWESASPEARAKAREFARCALDTGAGRRAVSRAVSERLARDPSADRAETRAEVASRAAERLARSAVRQAAEMARDRGGRSPEDAVGAVGRGLGGIVRAAASPSSPGGRSRRPHRAREREEQRFHEGRGA